MVEEDGVLVEEPREDKDGLDFAVRGITVRLVPQIDLGATTRSSIVGLSSLSLCSKLRATPNSEGALAAVGRNLVDGICAAGEE